MKNTKSIHETQAICREDQEQLDRTLVELKRKAARARKMKAPRSGKPARKLP
jgi:hypothetical protein